MRVDASRHVFAWAKRLTFEHLGQDESVFKLADCRRNLVGRYMAAGDPCQIDCQLHHLFGVVHVEDRVIFSKADKWCVATKKLGTEAMVGSHPNRLSGGKTLDALAHLVRRLVSKSEGRNPVAGDTLKQQVGDAMGDDSGLSAPWAGQYQQWPFEMRGGLALWVGQLAENRMHGAAVGLAVVGLT